MIARCFAAFAAALLLAGCGGRGWHATDVTGNLPPLAFTMTRANDDRTVTAADYRGRPVLLYFGYANCPDICPLTMTNLKKALRDAGPAAARTRILFVTVDPDRDTLPTLRDYARAFGPGVDTLRGDANQIAALAKRYRVAYSADPDAPGGYLVTHSSGVYAFDRDGKARLLISSLSTPRPDIAGTTADLRRLYG